VRGLWLEDRRLTLRDDLAVPTEEAVVRVRLAGICNTDIELTHGYYPFTGIPGHEFVGAWNGKRVVGEINASCGRCEACLNGRRTHCERRTVLGIKDRNGAFAEFLSLPAENLHEVPANVPDEEAVFVEPLAAALEIQQQIAITPHDRVVVVGNGKLGHLIARTLALTGCKVLVVGRDTANEVKPGAFDIAIECSGDTSGFAVARAALRPRGTLVMKSTYAGDLTFNASSLVVDEITLIGSRCGPFAPALQLLAERRVEVRDLVDDVFELKDGVAAFEVAQRKGAMKVLLRP
jgi:threonine dehydrogenase-like Zn-dependent dehydrogenase